MRPIYVILICLLALLINGCAHPTICKVDVVDTSGSPVPGAEVTVGWSWSYDVSGKTSPKSRHKTGTADARGRYIFVGMTKGGVGISATGQGYYRTFAGPAEANPVVVLLRKKQNPVPMYAKRAKLDLPSGNGNYAYDLFVGDLVAPHGVGTTTDLVFHVSTTTSNWRDRTIYRLNGDVVFPGSRDGIQSFFVPQRIDYPRSDYTLPFTAPETGYVSTLTEANGDTQTRYKDHSLRRENMHNLLQPWYWTSSYKIRDPAHYWSEDINYFVRVRSSVGPTPCYGLISGVVEFGYRGNDIPHISFTYYINPDGTTNIEYDPSQNLITEFRRYKLWEYSPGYP